MYVSVSSICNEFVVQVSVQMLDVYLVVTVKYVNICVDPRVVSVSLYDCKCVFVFGCRPRCVYLFATYDFVSRSVSELSWHLRWTCAPWSVPSLRGGRVCVGVLCPHALCVSLGLCPETSAVACAFVSVV